MTRPSRSSAADGQPRAEYARVRDDVATALDELADLLATSPARYDALTDRDALARTIARVRDDRFVLAVVGEFSSGKSFLLNALLGKVELQERAGTTRIAGLLATDINPSTATITELTFARDEEATAFYADGRRERIPLGRLARFVAVGEEAKLHDATADAADSPTLVRVAVDSPFLAVGFVVADTPGLASVNPAHRRATLGYLPGADAVLYLIDTQQPFSDGDASFLGIVQRYIESIFIVQTKIDLWRMRDGDRETWQTAAARIEAQAALHAPSVPVFPLSAREYAEGWLTHDDALVAQSRFPELLEALEASLVGTTGRARLRRAAAEARRVAVRVGDALTRDAAACERDEADLLRLRAALEPALQSIEAAAGMAHAGLSEHGAVLEAQIIEAGAALRAGLGRSLARAFDTADIARLRDRAKLHAIVDDTLARTVGDFAADVAERIARDVGDAVQAASDGVVDAGRAAHGGPELAAILDAIARERISLTEDAATEFGADSGGGAWSTNLQTGLQSTIVLGALGGPAVGLVSAIAQRFAGAPYGTYMKRELLADLGGDLYAAFDRDVAAFIAQNARRARAIVGRSAERVAALAPRIRGDALGAIDRALSMRRGGADGADAAAVARARAAAATALANRIETLAEGFAPAARPARPNREVAATPAPTTLARFNPATYEHGLRPERWRIAVLGALRRGKSSLINALAGERVLTDEGGEIEMRFPVHVRYGPGAAAYALSDDAAWDVIPRPAALDAATRTPVLIETPWSLPRELVLVHAPAFDSGSPDAEHIAFAAAAGASETLALFSRQLSDRELDIYGRIAALGKPMTFVHTLADNEAAAERRTVVALAERYLRERSIVPQRIFTVSAAESVEAHHAARAPAAWNEIVALRSTLAAHAEEHMARLERAEREQAELARLSRPSPPSGPARRSLVQRLFGRR